MANFPLHQTTQAGIIETTALHTLVGEGMSPTTGMLYFEFEMSSSENDSAEIESNELTMKKIVTNERILKHRRTVIFR